MHSSYGILLNRISTRSPDTNVQWIRELEHGHSMALAVMSLETWLVPQQNARALCPHHLHLYHECSWYVSDVSRVQWLSFWSYLKVLCLHVPLGMLTAHRCLCCTSAVGMWYAWGSAIT